MTNPSGADPVAQVHAASQAGPASRRPLLALIANLLAAPVGHVYLGEARRGFLLWLAVQVVTVLALLPIVLRPGRATVLLTVLVILGAVAILPIDAYQLARQRKSGYRLRKYNRWYAYVGILALAAVAGGLFNEIRRARVQAFRIPSGSMSPTLLVGDHIFVDKLTPGFRALSRGDVVVFPYPGDRRKDFLERIIGMPNDRIEIRDKQVLINGAALDEPYAVHTDSVIRAAAFDVRDNFGPHTIGPKELFLMGDNRENANDSRYWGPVAERDVKGRAVVIYWSWDAKTSRPRWDRVGKRIQ